MEAAPTDPRDNRREMPPTGYRVDFWEPLGDLNPRPLRIAVPFSQATFELTGARDVADALDWARANAGSRTFTLHAICDAASDQILVHLFGINPTQGYVSSRQAEEANGLFEAHGFPGRPLMHPVVTVDERIFVATQEELEAITDIDELITALERVLQAPVRIETGPTHHDVAHLSPG